MPSADVVSGGVSPIRQDRCDTNQLCEVNTTVQKFMPFDSYTDCVLPFRPRKTGTQMGLNAAWKTPFLEVCNE